MVTGDSPEGLLRIKGPDGDPARRWRVIVGVPWLRWSGSIARVAGTVILVGYGSLARGNPPLRPTVCEIARHQQAFNGKIVRVSGTIESDGQEYTLITDAACAPIGIGFEYTAAASRSPTAQQLRNAILFTGKPGTQDKVITVTLVGRFFGNRKTWPTRLILVKKVSNLSVRPIK